MQSRLLTAGVVRDAGDIAGNGRQPACLVVGGRHRVAVGEGSAHDIAQGVVALRHRVSRTVEQALRLADAPQGVIGECRDGGKIRDPGDASPRVRDRRIIVRPLDLLGAAGVGLRQHTALQVVGEREGLILRIGLADEVASHVVAVRPAPHVGVTHRGLPAEEVVGERGDVVEMVRREHERTHRVGSVGRHVRVAAIDLLDTSETPINIQEAAPDVTALICHRHPSGNVRCADAGSIRVEHLRPAAAGVVLEPRQDRGLGREVRRGLRCRQAPRVEGGLALDDLVPRPLRPAEIVPPQSIEIDVVPEDRRRAVLNGAIRQDALGRGVAEVEIEPAHRAIERTRVERAGRLRQAAERIVGVRRALMIGVGLGRPLAPARVVGKGRRVAETGGDAGRIRLASLVDGGRRAAAGIRGGCAVAVGVIHGGDDGITCRSLGPAQAPLLLRQKATGSERSPGEAVIREPAFPQHRSRGIVERGARRTVEPCRCVHHPVRVFVSLVAAHRDVAPLVRPRRVAVGVELEALARDLAAGSGVVARGDVRLRQRDGRDARIGCGRRPGVRGLGQERAVTLARLALGGAPPEEIVLLEPGIGVVPERIDRADRRVPTKLLAIAAEPEPGVAEGQRGGSAAPVADAPCGHAVAVE